MSEINFKKYLVIGYVSSTFFIQKPDKVKTTHLAFIFLVQVFLSDTNRTTKVLLVLNIPSLI